MSRKSACEFKSSFLSTKSFFIKRGAIDIYQNIIDLNLFRKLNRLWSDKATEKYKTTGTLFTEIRKSGKTGDVYLQASPNMELFQTIDTARFPGEQLSLFQIESEDARPPLESLDRKVTSFLNKIGVDVKSVSELKIKNDKGALVDAVSVARIMQKVVEVAEGKAKIDTLGEEATHFLVELMGEHPLVQAMINDITGYEVYKQVQSQYVGVEGYDELTMKKEAVGKLIAKILVAKETGEEIPQKAITRWEALWNVIKKMFSKLTFQEIREAVSPFEIAAQKILIQDISELSFDNLTKDTPLQMFQLSQESINYREEVLRKLTTAFVVNDAKTSKYYRTADGKAVTKRVSDSIKQYYRRIFKTKTGNRDDMESLRSAHAGTVIHKVMELIFNERWKGEEVDYDKVIKEVEAQLREVPEFADKAEDYFESIVRRKDFKRVIVKTVDGVIGQIREVEDRIADEQGYTAEDRENHKPVILSELSIYDEIEDIAGTIDLAVVHSNGAVSIFDWKSMIFDTVGKVTASDVQWYKRGAWDQQLAFYKHMLQKNYGVTQFALSRLIPINIQFDKEDKIKLMQTIFSNDNDPHLNLVPSIVERTGYAAIDSKIDHLAKKRNDLLEAHLKNRKNKKLVEALDRIDDVIKRLQVKQDVGYIHTQLAAIEAKIIKAEHETSATTVDGKANPNYLDLSLLNEYREFVELFRDFATKAVEHAKQYGDEESVLKLERIDYLISSIVNKINTKVHDDVLTRTGIDIDKPSEEAGFLGKIFNKLSQFKNPMLKAMSKLVIDNYAETREATNQLYDKLKPITDDLKVWASSRGISTNEAFKLLYNKDTGSLHKRISSKYKEDLQKARDDKDEKWFLKNTQITSVESLDEGEKPTFQYTGDALERYKKSRKSLEEWLHMRYDGFEESEKTINRKMWEWDSKNSISKFPNALFNKKNQFIRLNESTTEYNSKEWEFIQANEPLKKFYDTYNEVMEELLTGLGVPVDGHFVANIQQSFIDSMLQTGNIGPGALRDRLLQSMQLRQDDKYRGVLGNTDDMKSIPLLMYDPIREPLNSKERESVENKVKAYRNKDGSVMYTEGSKEYKEALEAEIRNEEYNKGRKLKSIDLSKSLLLFAESVNLHKAFSATEGMVKAMQASMANPMQETYAKDKNNKFQEDAFTHKLATKLGIPKGDAEVFDKFVDLYWYGISGGSGGDVTFTIAGREYSGKKTYQNVMQYITMKAIGLKPLIAIGNVIGAKSNAFMLATEGRYFTAGQLLHTQKRFVNKDAKWTAFAGFFEPYSHSMTMEKARKLSADKLMGWATTDNLYVLMRLGDEGTSNDVLLSMAQNYGIDPTDKKIKRLSQISDKTVKSLLDSAVLTEKGLDIPGLSPEEFQRFRQMTMIVANKIIGTIPIEDKNLVSTSLFTSSLMMFKNWIPGLARTRFAKFGRDEMGEFDGGRFSMALGEFTAKGFLPKLNAFKELMVEIATMGYYNGKVNEQVALKYYEKYCAENRISRDPNSPDFLSFEDFKNLRLAKLKSLGTELGIFISFLLAVLGARMMIPDDKDDPTRKAVVIGYRMLNRGLLETSFFLDPRSATQVTTNIIPPVRLLNEITKWTRNTVKIGFDDITGYTPKKSEKTRHRGYYTSKMFPVVTSVTDFFDVWESYNADSYWKY